MRHNGPQPNSGEFRDLHRPARTARTIARRRSRTRNAPRLVEPAPLACGPAAW
jgi:hypothetical protein